MAGGASGDDDDMISAINVTPLVDITLVLLVVFMVTAKIIVSNSLPLDLPKAAKGETVQLVFGIELHANDDIVIDGKKVANEKAVLAAAREAISKNKELRAVIRADSSVKHGRVIRVIDLLKQAKINKIAFGVSPTKAEGPAGGTVPVEPAPATP